MKKIILLFALLPFLICTKCADKEFNIKVINKTKNNYLLYKKTEDIPLKKMIKNRGHYVPNYVIIKKNETAIDTTLNEYDLDFYLSKDREYYTFYFYKFITITKNRDIEYFINKKYDSINVDVNEIQLGKKGKNIFIFHKGMIYFKN
jgi:ethanolamine utilization protein EutP (predicted NTPase)